MHTTKRIIIVLTALLTVNSWAIDPVKFDSQDELDRFQQLTYELRCPKCQNQNLIDSDSQISDDLRAEIARLIKEGLSDEEIKTSMVALYGDFILYKPPVQSNTIVLWAAPAVLLLIGAMIFFVTIVKRSRLNEDEENELEN